MLKQNCKARLIEIQQATPVTTWRNYLEETRYESNPRYVKQILRNPPPPRVKIAFKCKQENIRKPPQALWLISLVSHCFPANLSLLHILVDRTYKINNTWMGFHEDITKLTKILQKNLFPVHLVENIINRYLAFTRHDCKPRPQSLTLHKPFTLNFLTLVIDSPFCQTLL